MVMGWLKEPQVAWMGAGARDLNRDPRRFRSRPLLAAVLGLGLMTGGLWLGPALVAPPPAMAYTSRLDLFITRAPEESFDALVRRSEIIARAAVQRSFDADLLITEVKVTIVADSQGISVPILTVEVGRNDWRALPDVEEWAQYYSAARGLMEAAAQSE